MEYTKEQLDEFDRINAKLWSCVGYHISNKTEKKTNICLRNLAKKNLPPEQLLVIKAFVGMNAFLGNNPIYLDTKRGTIRKLRKQFGFKFLKAKKENQEDIKIEIFLDTKYRACEVDPSNFAEIYNAFYAGDKK